jgi:hypothetical protein
MRFVIGNGSVVSLAVCARKLLGHIWGRGPPNLGGSGKGKARGQSEAVGTRS